MDAESYFLIKDKEDNVVFEINSKNEIKYIKDGKLRTVETDAELIESVRAMMKGIVEKQESLTN